MRGLYLYMKLFAAFQYPLCLGNSFFQSGDDAMFIDVTTLYNFQQRYHYSMPCLSHLQARYY